jgi:hypothetical protein
MWLFFSHLLPNKSRQECFEPAYGDFLEEYITARRPVGISGQCWIGFVFTLRAVLIVVECYRLYLIGLLSGPIRNWWRRQ